MQLIIYPPNTHHKSTIILTIITKINYMKEAKQIKPGIGVGSTITETVRSTEDNTM